MKEKKFVRLGKYLWGLLIILIIIFPVYWIVISSFKSKAEIITYPPKLFPSELTFDNYINAVQNYNIGLYLKNSLIVTIITVVLSIAIAALTAYAISFFRFRMAKPITSVLYLLQVLPSVTMVLPLFIIYSKMGLSNTYTSLIITYVASVTGTPIAIILMNGYFSDIPKDLFEAASIDGAGTFKAFFKILLPLGMSGIICTAIYIFILTWQEFMFAVNLITDTNMYTMPVGLQMFVGEFSTDWGSMLAATTIIAVPAIILFVSVQNYFIDNVAGSVKE